LTHSAFTQIGACVFDAYGTLFDFHSAVARGGAALGDKAQAVSQLWREKQIEYTWLRNLMGAYVDFWQITGDGLDYALAAHGVDDRVLRDQLMELYLNLNAYPEVADSLARLRAGGQTTAVLSNGAPKMLRAAATSAGIDGLLDKILSVDEIGIYKPDARVYQIAVDRLGVPADQICYVSANGWDACGAAHFGFNVAWINRFGLAPERLPGKPAATIESLADVPPLLGL
jgi:2-haloacid dehalogenase